MILRSIRSSDRDQAIPGLWRQSRGKLKTIPTAPENRIWAGLRGGGRILLQPVSNLNFPDNRENNREFLNFRPFSAILAPNRRARSAGYNKIPYATEQGINLTEQGRFRREQGISVQEQDSRIWLIFQAVETARLGAVRTSHRNLTRLALPAGLAQTARNNGCQCASPSI